MAPEILYRVYFQGRKYSQPSWEIHKLIDGEPAREYLVTGNKCNCEGATFHRVRCRHLLLRDYFETHNRPICFLRVSGSVNIFQVPLEGIEE